MALIDVQHWDMPDPPAGNIALCKCGHAKSSHVKMGDSCMECVLEHGAPAHDWQPCTEFRPMYSMKWTSTISSPLEDLKAISEHIRRGRR